MVQIISVLALGATQVFGSVVTKLADDAQHALFDPDMESDRHFSSVQDELKKAEIIPTVIDEFLPSLHVDVHWPSSKHAELGNTVKPKKLQDEPTITLFRPESIAGVCSSVANVTYTVTLTDPDAPSRDDPKWSEMCHWIATGLALPDDDEDSSCSPFNVLTLTLTNLEEVMPYKPPGPPEKTGKHRYVLFVFAPANGTTDPLHLKKPEDRQHWGYDFDGESVGVRRWSLENGLVPVAANFIYSQNKKQ